jgi:hypothetical protein
MQNFIQNKSLTIFFCNLGKWLTFLYITQHLDWLPRNIIQWTIVLPVWQYLRSDNSKMATKRITSETFLQYIYLRVYPFD